MTDLQACLVAARGELVAARALVRRELASYPTPISGCDVQYTHLIEARDTIREALAALDRPRFTPTPRIQEPGARVESR
ncbi:MAG: hypothetical protein ACU0CO_13880 [Shimia sp.]